MSHQSVCFLLNTSFWDLKCPFKVCAFISTLNRGTKMSHHDKNHTLFKVQRANNSSTVVYKDNFDLTYHNIREVLAVKCMRMD